MTKMTVFWLKFRLDHFFSRFGQSKVFLNGTCKRYFVMSLGGTLDSGTLGVPVYPQCQSQAQATVYRSLVFFAHKKKIFLHKKNFFPRAIARSRAIARDRHFFVCAIATIFARSRDRDRVRSRSHGARSPPYRVSWVFIRQKMTLIGKREKKVLFR